MAEVTKVFLSSTFRDLEKHRAEAIRAINSLPGCRCLASEEFPPDKRAPAEYTRRRVRECHAFVGVLGTLYGSSPPDDGRSFVEIEYEEALASRQPLHMFVTSEDFPVSGSLREDDGRWMKQQAFRERVMASHTCRSFRSPEELATEIAATLARWLADERDRASEPAVLGPPTGPSVFISYSHKDDVYREQLETHLTVLRRQGVLDTWSDRRLLPGDDWGKSIGANLQACRLFLVLVSADLLASDYCYDVEIQQALQRHATGDVRVIPIIVRPCVWESSPLGHLQALPRDAKAVAMWENPDAAWTDVVRGIMRALSA